MPDPSTSGSTGAASPKRIRLLILSCVLGFLTAYSAGCARNYMDIVGPIHTGGVLGSHARCLDVQLLDGRTAAPLPDVEVTIGSSSHPVDLVSDADGWVRLPLRTEFVEENPPVFIRHPGPVDLHVAPMSSGRPAGRWDAVRCVSLDGMKSLEAGPLRVWCIEGQTARAAAVMNVLERQGALITEMTGLQPPAWGVVLLPQKDRNVQYVPAGQGTTVAWVHSEGEVSSGEFERDNMRRWTSMTIERTLGLLEADPRNRFICDGLGEWLASQDVGLPDGYGDGLRELQERGIRWITLPDRFVATRPAAHYGMVGEPEDLTPEATSAGYALSFAFWKELSAEHGSDFPARFLARMSARENRDTGTAVDVLSDMTEGADVGRLLRNASVDHALALIEGLQ
jgi:hypothetical protein